MSTAWQTACGAVTVLVAAGTVSAQSVVYVLDGAQSGDGFGATVATAGDLDGDGVLELLVGVPIDSTNAPESGMAVVYSGRSGLAIRHMYGTDAGDGLGSGVAGVDDIDRDGVRDLLIGVPGASSGATDSGLAMILSGVTGQTLRLHTWPYAGEGFGKGAWNIGDADNDGVTDYGITSTVSLDIFDPHVPELLCWSGADGHELSALHTFGPSDLAPAGDTNGDGRNEVLRGYTSVAQLIHGITGNVLDLTPSASDMIAGFGPAGDFDGDGLNEYVFAWGPVAGTQFIQIRSKPNGVLLSLAINVTVATPGMAAAFDGTADVNQDGVLDLIVGFPFASQGPIFSGLVRVYSGTSGTLLAEFQGQLPFEAFGSRVRVLGDTNGDGFPEFEVSAPANTGPSGVPGRMRVLTLGPVPWSHTGAPLAGLAGVPTLSSLGPLVPGTKVSVKLTQALQGAPAVLVLGFSQRSVPFKGGVLGPSPDVVFSPVSVSGAATPLIDATWPTGIAPGTLLFMQAWIKDAGGPAGYAATDTLVATTPP